VLAFLGIREEGGCKNKEKETCRAQFGEFLDWACKNCDKRKD